MWSFYVKISVVKNFEIFVIFYILKYLTFLSSILSHAGVYTKEEIVRIFKVKMSKLQLLYKKQMQLLSEKIINEREKYMEMKDNERGRKEEKKPSSSKEVRATRKYRSSNSSNSKKELYLKEKFDPNYYESPHSIYSSSHVTNRCIFVDRVGNSEAERCRQTCVPLSKYCKKRNKWTIKKS